MSKAKITSGECQFKNVLKSVSKNCHYMRWKNQNEIISTTGKYVKNAFVEDANARFFSVLSDGTTDNSINEQLNIVLSFVKKKQTVHAVRFK